MLILLQIAAGLAVLYLALLAAAFVIMRLPPARLARIVSLIPEAVHATGPYRLFWLAARGGRLRMGDAAPDFDLETVEKNSRVRLSTFRGHKPVVLIFGSYT
jgi:hypothetical protein